MKLKLVNEDQDEGNSSQQLEIEFKVAENDENSISDFLDVSKCFIL